MDETAASKSTFFNRHWIISLIMIWVLILFISEIFLRIADPNIFKFVYNSRRVFTYSTPWRIDLEANGIAHLHLRTDDDQDMFNFVLTTSKDGFRTYDRELDSDYSYDGKQKEVAAGTRYVHAVGDSFTMGWGVDYTSSYPAILDRMLPDNYRVLNLGVPGFGAIAATEKSLSLWEKYPPEHAVYLFCPDNDFHDDTKLVKYRRPGYKVYHVIRNIYSFFRKYTYIANIPYVIWTSNIIHWKERRMDLVIQKVKPTNITVYKDFIINDPAAVSVDRPDHPTFRQVSEYADYLKQRDRGFTVLLIDTSPEAYQMYSYCIANDIDVYMFSIPEKMRLYRDGHFSYAGNYIIAKFLQDRVLKSSPDNGRQSP